MGTISDIMENAGGATIISVMLGLGLAAIFRRVCDDKKCVVIRAPNNEELEKYYYQVQDECYKYTPENVACPKKS
jgi:uncharacterized protein (TIGR03382 family)